MHPVRNVNASSRQVLNMVGFAGPMRGGERRVSPGPWTL